MLLDICRAGYLAAPLGGGNPHPKTSPTWLAYECGRHLWTFREEMPLAVEVSRDHLQPLGYIDGERKTLTLTTANGKNFRLTLHGDDLSKCEMQLVSTNGKGRGE